MLHGVSDLRCARARLSKPATLCVGKAYLVLLSSHTHTRTGARTQAGYRSSQPYHLCMLPCIAICREMTPASARLMLNGAHVMFVGDSTARRWVPRCVSPTSLAMPPPLAPPHDSLDCYLACMAMKPIAHQSRSAAEVFPGGLGLPRRRGSQGRAVHRCEQQGRHLCVHHQLLGCPGVLHSEAGSTQDRGHVLAGGG